MMENLTPLTFSDFGELLGVQNREGYEKNTVASGERPEVYRVWKDAPVILDHPRGMAILRVYSASAGPARMFYLDKPVRLKPGVAFAVIPLEASCQVDLYTPAGTVSLDMPMDGQEVPVLRPRVSIPCLYTLFYQEKPKGFYFPGESHTPYELTYVDMGKLHCVAGGRDMLLNRQDLMLFAPKQWHMQYAQPDEGASFLTISFDVHPLDLPLSCGAALPATKEIRACLAQILSVYKEKGDYQGDMILCLLTQVLLLLLARPAGQEKPEASSPAESMLVEQALQYMDTHCIRRLTVKEVARHVHVSPGYLAVLFRRQVKAAPLAYIQHLRLARSRHLLLNGENSIAQVAFALGYATPQHFSRCFKKEFGFSPREYIYSLKAPDLSEVHPALRRKAQEDSFFADPQR